MADYTHLHALYNSDGESSVGGGYDGAYGDGMGSGRDGSGRMREEELQSPVQVCVDLFFGIFVLKIVF